ncbi:unnamed protein product [Allacma fusca]|uniref:Calponin-homology (CH) domain-containing protein n=1 Tax=Allacma fusca TaxID=39272 RepID=A0A8J2PLA7_9HEXA|nr:unnamed protein product [Allacma fusca]
MANAAISLDTESLRTLYAWLDAVPLSRPKRNIAEDFSDGVLMAEVFAFFVPKLIDISLYKEATDDESKKNNWKLLNQNVFSALEIRLSDYTIIQIADAKSGIIEQVLWEMRKKLQDSTQSYSNSVEVVDTNAGFSIKEMSGISDIASDRGIWKPLLAELLGTVILVFVGCGTYLQWGKPATVDSFGSIKKESTLTETTSSLQISLAFGITVATVTQAIGHISGSHINPAVTLGLMIAGQIKPVRSILYIASQCAGAVAGAAILKGVAPEGGGSLGITVPHEDVCSGQAFGIECMITFVVVLTVLGVYDENRNDVKGSIPLAIGLSVTACSLSAMKFTGASMNPARTFGPAVISYIWTDHWIYWAGPCAGGVAAGLVYSSILRAPKPAPVITSDVPAPNDPITKSDAKDIC